MRHNPQHLHALSAPQRPQLAVELGQDPWHPLQDMLGHRRQLAVGRLNALQLVCAQLGSRQHDPLGRPATAA